MGIEVKNALIFPCGSECALEIHRSLACEKYINVFGATSVENNPGKFLYENYIPDLMPYITADDFLDRFNDILRKHAIDLVFPALDRVAMFFSEHRDRIGAEVVTSSAGTNRICYSKRVTYEHLSGIVMTPKVFCADEVTEDMLPVFLKPEIGQGSQGTVLAKDLETVEYHTSRHENLMVLEYLPGVEYTIDCFTDRHGNLLFSRGRQRRRVRTGISVNSVSVRDERFGEWAQTINSAMDFRGAWFFQVKENDAGEFVLMEVAARIAGSSALARNSGVNLSLLSVYDRMGLDVEVLENDVENEIDRSFDHRFRIDHEFDTVYCDYDDCLVIRDKVNSQLVRFLYDCTNHGIRLVLLTRHADDIHESLGKTRLSGLFDEVVHIQEGANKANYIETTASIFVDDSHAERKSVRTAHGIPVYSPDAAASITCIRQKPVGRG